MPKILTVRWVAAPGCEERVAQIVRIMTRLTREELGCVAYQGHRSRDDAREFLLYEHYVDEAAFQAHVDSDHFARYVAGEAVGLLEGRERRQWDPLDVAEPGAT
ncbi:MAG: antibiotic biosynthesis monooxygenase [Actinomycetota bacterium]|nr:antibiotic biosynthesis monooxygenase [Actinomycetota bacterium]